MARTINRQPITVDTDVDTNLQFFNQVNWKGICTNKNYLNLDQETFEDCKNIYVDANGILKSRPSFKASVLINKPGYICQKSWNFLNVQVYLVKNTTNDTYRLYFIQSGIESEYSVSCSNNPTLFLFDEKIVIITDNRIYYYADMELYDFAKPILYKPIKYIITNNNKEEYETDNVLINAYRERYIYNNIVNIDNVPYLNKEVTIRYNNKVETKEFVEGTEKSILLPKFSIKANNVNDTDDILMSVSSLNNIILSTINDNDEYIISYSPDGKSFTQLPSFGKTIYGKPLISKDGTIAIVFSDDGPYAYSLLDTKIRTYGAWTNLLDNDTYENLRQHKIGNTSTGDSLTSDAVYKAIGGTFVDDKNYIYVYAIQPILYDLKLFYEQIVIVKCVDGVIDYRIWPVPVPDTLYINNFIATDFINEYDIFACYIMNINEDGYSRLKLDVSSTNADVTGASIDTSRYLPAEYHDLIVDILLYSDKTSKFIYDGGDRLRVFTLNLYKDTIDSDSIEENIAKAFILSNGDIITDKGYYFKRDVYNKVDLDNLLPIKSYGSLYVHDDAIVYSNYIGDDIVTIDVEYESNIVPVLEYEHYCKLNEHYLSSNNSLYISMYREEDGKQLLYIPKINIQKFDDKITNIYPISETQIAIFFKDEIWHSDIDEQGRYLYYKSKLQTGLLEGSDVITSVDGKNIIFSSTRGLVYMSYQELVQSTEQTLTYLSDIIFDFYDTFNKKPVKLFINKFWLYIYHNDENVFYIFDMRNNSWWKWEYNAPILNIILIDDVLYVFTDKGIRTLDYSNNNYYDVEGFIDWYFTSQKLHLGTLNYSKNIASIIINNVENEYTSEDVSFNLSINNYRVNVSNRYVEPQNLTYKVNALRTFVKRCNSRKVNEFQYTVSSDTGDNANAIQLPLSIHSIIIKYSIAGQVR